MEEALKTMTGAPVFVTGKSGFLFLTGGAHDVLAYVEGRREIRKISFQIFTSNLKLRNTICEKACIPYVHIVCPDKHSALSEYFPYPIKNCVGDIFLENCKVKFIYPKEALQAVPHGLSYCKTDTHWAMEGRITAVTEILRQFGLMDDGAEQVLQRIRASGTLDPKFCGDLGTKATPKITEAIISHKISPDIRQFSNGLIGNNGLIRIYFNKRAPVRRLLLFGDSFMLSCHDIITEFFQTVMMVRSPNFHKEAFRLFAPTHVVTSNAERYLTAPRPDRGAAISFLLGHLSGKPMNPTPGFYEALNAALLPASPTSRAFFEGLEAVALSA